MDTIMKAVHLMDNKQTEEALQLLDNHLLVTDDDKKYTIAELYLQWGLNEKAQSILQDLLHRYPEENDIKIMLADIYIGLEDDQSAINLLSEIDANDPSYLQALLQMADLYEAQGLFEVAELKLLEAKQINPNEPIIDFALGEFLFSIGEYNRATTYYEKILPEIKELSNVQIPARLAEAHAAQGNYEIALEYFNTFETSDPDILFKYGLTAYYAKRKDIAINVWNRVIELDEYYHTVYYELAKAYRDEGRIEEAFTTIKKGLEMDEFNKELYYYAGVLANQLNKFTDSVDYIRQAIVLDSDYKDAVLFLIELFKTEEEHTKIIELITDIKNEGAIDPLYEWEIARAFVENEAYDQALEHYHQAYNNLKQDTDFLKEYGYFLVEEGEVEQAVTVFNNYLTKEPTDDETREYVERLVQSKDDK
ncbi:MAG TPA: tetratricopeptide repeat protein [Virgibacillus sp.]|nr:tetratricopeptide repeat protein [Virgibacillus sp.]